MACCNIIISTLLKHSALIVFLCVNHVFMEKVAEVHSEEDAEFETSANSRQFDNKAVIVLASTFPLGLVVGALWCYCMSTVCKTRQSDYKQLRLRAPTQRRHFVQSHYPEIPRPGYSLDSPMPSDVSSRTSSPLP